MAPPAPGRRPTGTQRLSGAVAISREKIQTLADFWPLSGFFFSGPADQSDARERWLGEQGREALSAARAALAELGEFSEATVAGALEAVVAARGVQAARDLPAAARCDRRNHRIAGHLRERRAAGPRGDAAPRSDRALQAN